MRLTIKERLILLSILPAEGSFLTLRLVRELREALSFSEEELAAFKLIVEGERASWDEAPAPEGVDIPVGERMTELIAQQLGELDRACKLTDDHFSLCEKFLDTDKEQT